ncbi:hypothetical protein ABH904_002935 [Pseudomonas frederiksbergensis]
MFDMMASVEASKDFTMTYVHRLRFAVNLVWHVMRGMRGRPSVMANNAEPRRNTPTGVGKTRLFLESKKTFRKHPHGCGEDRVHRCDFGEVPETPPRMWGRLPLGAVQHLPIGNTPTGVGKTVPRRTNRPASRKHPHGCGEDDTKECMTRQSLETPPRVWGRPVDHRRRRRAAGNTPTGVGKTRPRA